MMVHELAEWRPPVSRTPASDGAPAVWVYTLRAGVVRGGNRFRPRLVRVVDTRKAVCSEDGIVV